MAELRKISPDELKKILEDHRTWVESEGKEGGKADLSKANLQEADLFGANLQGAVLSDANLQEASLFLANLQNTNLIFANLQQARGLSESQVRQAKNWRQAFYNDDFLKELGLPPDHNKKLKKVLAELEMKKKKAATKK